MSPFRNSWDIHSALEECEKQKKQIERERIEKEKYYYMVTNSSASHCYHIGFDPFRGYYDIDNTPIGSVGQDIKVDSNSSSQGVIVEKKSDQKNDVDALIAHYYFKG